MGYWVPTMLAALAGGFVAAQTQIFSLSTVSDLSLALGIGIAAIALGALRYAVSKGWAYVVIAALTAVLGGWLIVESQVFSDATVKWLSLAAGGGVLGLSLIGLALHERSTERVVHSLEVKPDAQRKRSAAAA